MKRSVLIILATLLVACSATPTDIPTVTPSLLLTITVSPTFTITPTETLIPTMTLRPAETVSFYHLRLEYTSKSDWAKLLLEDPGNILTMRLVAVSGETTTASISMGENKRRILDLDQALAAAQAGAQVSMMVDIAFPAQNPPQSLSFLSEHGDLHGTGLRVSTVSGENISLVKEINHYWVDQNNPDTSAWNVTVDLRSMTLEAPSQVQIQRPNHMMWAVYYAGYGNATGSGGWFWPDMVVDRPLNLYNSMDRQAIALQIKQAKSAGIDGFFVSDSDLRDNWFGIQFRILLDEAAKQDFRIALFLEAADNPHNRMQSTDDLFAWLAYAISTYGHDPAYMQWNGKPLVVIYAAGGYPPSTWAGIFDRLHSQGLDGSYLAMGYDLANLEVFDGIGEYAIFDYPDLSNLYSSLALATKNYPLLSPDSQAKTFMATVQPGFNNSYWTTSPTIVDRENGQYYRKTLDAAVNSDADWIMVTSWNEYTEATNIEPSELYGDQYLQITREYADAWKNK